MAHASLVSCVATSPAQARQFVRSVLGVSGGPDAEVDRGADDAALLVSELVTIAVGEGGGGRRATVSVASDDRRAHVEVLVASEDRSRALLDGGPSDPAQLYPLRILNSIATDWGHAMASGLEGIWFEVPRI